MTDSLLPAFARADRRFFGNTGFIRRTGFCAFTVLRPEELLSEKQPNFNVLLDPKCDWALRHLEAFPSGGEPGFLRDASSGAGDRGEVGAADCEGQAAGDSWISADLKRMGVVLKRALYFITCKGKTQYPLKMDEDFILRNLLSQRDQTLPEVRELSAAEAL